MDVRASKIRYQGTRDEQQDTVSVFQVSTETGNAIAIGVLTDGIGGLSHGGDASSLVNATVEKTIKAAFENIEFSSKPLIDVFVLAAKAANQELAAYQNSQNIEICGCTLLVVGLGMDRLNFISIGDSPLWMTDRNDRLIRLNIDHTTDVNGKSALTSAVLGDEISEIDAGEVDLSEQDIQNVLLSSDGIRSLPIDRVTEQLTSSEDNKLRSIVHEVAALESDSQDNMSMILFEF
ncbi:MAG: hypothetical protein CMM59_07445 [Rhodospirillaceae bacterium]|nr:hypothetical protein [Rhodospirillaceae bacterium]